MPSASPTEQKQETEKEKKKRMDETKIRKIIFDIKYMKDRIAEMLSTQGTKDV